MKAVLGFLFILVGITVGWLVVSGKLPNPNPSAPAAVASSATPAQINARYRNQMGVLGGLSGQQNTQATRDIRNFGGMP